MLVAVTSEPCWAANARSAAAPVMITEWPATLNSEYGSPAAGLRLLTMSHRPRYGCLPPQYGQDMSDAHHMSRQNSRPGRDSVGRRHEMIEEPGEASQVTADPVMGDLQIRWFACRWPLTLAVLAERPTSRRAGPGLYPSPQVSPRRRPGPVSRFGVPAEAWGLWMGRGWWRGWVR